LHKDRIHEIDQEIPPEDEPVVANGLTKLDLLVTKTPGKIPAYRREVWSGSHWQMFVISRLQVSTTVRFSSRGLPHDFSWRYLF
jgi:hypothetical protein